MKFAATIVVRKTENGFKAGFASKVGKGLTVASFGKWYGSQMSYQPFKRAMSEAISLAEKLNAEVAAE